MRVVVILLLSFISTIALANGRVVPGYDDDEARLLKDIFSKYNKKLRPVLHKNHTVRVIFGLTLNQIIDVIEKYELLKLSLYIRQIWKNPLLAWNRTEYGGIKQVNLEPSELWKPDLYLYNNADSGADGSLYGYKAKIKVEFSGYNLWLAPTILTTSCKINVKYFPFDQQACKLKFGSWTHDAGSVDIVAQGPSASLGGYQLNGEWDLISFPCVRNAKKYVCCPHPFTDVTCTLNIRRRTLYYWVNLVVPCLLITVMSLLSFIVTTESGERISLVITNLLALTVFMMIVADILPPTSEVVPLISIFITSSIAQVGLSLVATCFVLQCYHTNPDINEMPFWMRHFVCEKLGPLLRVTHVKDRKAKEDASKEGKKFPATSTTQLRNLISGYNTRPSELRSAANSMSTAATYCKLCQSSNIKGSQMGTSRRSSIYAPPETFKDNYADSINIYRGRNESFADQYRGRAQSYPDQYRGRNDSADQYRGRNDYADPYRGRDETNADQYRGGNDYADQYRGRNDSADQYHGRSESNADQPYRGHKDSFANQPLGVSPDQINTQSKPACGRDQECIAALGAIIHRQDHLVEGVQKLTEVVDEQEQASAARDEWVYAAHVIDRFFLYLFIIVLGSSIVVTFTMVPTYQDK